MICGVDNDSNRKTQNVDLDVIEHFGKEWKSFDQSILNLKNFSLSLINIFLFFLGKIYQKIQLGLMLDVDLVGGHNS